MTRVEWGAPGENAYETGTDRAVLYVDGEDGVPWNGFRSVEEIPIGGTVTRYYLDGEMYLHVTEREEFSARISAFYSPEKFDECDGMVAFRSGLFATQQPRKPFHLTYRTLIGNDTEAQAHGYKIHLVYNALAEPATKSYSSIGQAPEASDLSWTVFAKPVGVEGASRSAHFIIDTTRAEDWAVSELEDILYGSDAAEPRMPLPDEIAVLFDPGPVLVVTDHGDGTFTVDGPDEAIVMLNPETFEITWDSAFNNNEDTFIISSL